MCQARDTFYTCLGSEYHSCTDVFTIMREQCLNADNSFTLADIYNDMKFDCNVGLARKLSVIVDII